MCKASCQRKNLKVLNKDLKTWSKYLTHIALSFWNLIILLNIRISTAQFNMGISSDFIKHFSSGKRLCLKNKDNNFCIKDEVSYLRKITKCINIQSIKWTKRKRIVCNRFWMTFLSWSKVMKNSGKRVCIITVPKNQNEVKLQR